MIFILNILGPIIILVALGMLLRSKGFASAEFFKQTNKLVFWVGLPALLFSKAIGMGGIDDKALTLFFVLASSMFSITFVGYAVSLFIKMPSKSWGAFVQGGYRSNLAFVGLPVVFFALESVGANDVIQGRAVMAIIPLMICYNLLAIPVLFIGQSKEEGAILQKLIASIKKVITNPIIISAGLGLILGSFGLTMPLMMQRTLGAIGSISLPLALMGVGSALVFDKVRPVALYATFSAVLKIIINPIICYFICGLFGLSGVDRLMGMLYSASPTAAISYVMTDQLGGDSDLSAGVIVLTTLLAPISLGVVLGLFA